MSARNGDKSRHGRQRKAKILRRKKTMELVQKIGKPAAKKA